MSEDTLFESEILKSLETLDGLLEKSQIGLTPGSKPKPIEEWGDGDIEMYDSYTDAKWDDDVDDHGDYKKKSMSKAVEEEEEEEDVEEEEKSIHKGIEVSEFLNELAKSVAYYCSELENYVVKSIDEVHEVNGRINKAVATNLLVVQDEIAKSQHNLLSYADEPARAPKSITDLSKSVGSPMQTLDKRQVVELLVKGVEAGQVSPLEVIKCEQFGVQAVDQNILKSLAG